ALRRRLAQSAQTIAAQIGHTGAAPAQEPGTSAFPVLGTTIARRPRMAIVDIDMALELLGWRQDSPSGARAALSPREQQILGLLAHGRTQKETAFELGVADATVRVLYSRAMKKL